MLPVYFNVLFIAVNGYFIARIVDERRDVELCGDAAALWDSALSDSGLRGRPCRLVEAGDVVLLQPGEIRCREGAPRRNRVAVVLRGGIVRGSLRRAPRGHTRRRLRRRVRLRQEAGRRGPPRACKHVLWRSRACRLISWEYDAWTTTWRRGRRRGAPSRRRREEAHREAEARNDHHVHDLQAPLHAPVDPAGGDQFSMVSSR